MTRLILLRHGETEWNLEKRAQGYQDSPLSKTGLAQARAIARRMANQPFDLLYSSDLKRAWRTAGYIAQASGHTPVADPCLRERHLGIREGLTREEFAARYPGIWKVYRTADPEAPLPGGESLGEFHRRAAACCESLVQRHPGQTIVAVTHGGFLGQVFRHVLGLPINTPRQFEIFNAAYNELFYSPQDGWKVVTWGGIAHLREMPLDEDEAEG
jgi:probable phosphoglycerate mutase